MRRSTTAAAVLLVVLTARGAPHLASPAARVEARDGTAQSRELYDDTVVHDVSLTFASDNWLSLLGCERSMRPPGGTTERTDVPAELVVDGVVLSNVGVHCKGNSSLSINGSKKPLNVTTDAFVPGQALWGIDVFNLDNNWSDPSQLRSAIALRTLREYMPVPRFSFARVTVQGKYVGLYTMSEQVNGEFVDYWYAEDDGIVVKGDSPERIAFNSSTLEWLGENLASYKQKYEVKGPAADRDDGYIALRELTRALDAPPGSGGLSDSAFAEGVRQQFDVETALWYLAASNIIANFDSYYVGKNYFLYLGDRDPRFHMITWDTGLSFGVFGLQGGTGRPGGASSSTEADPFAQETADNRPLIRRLLAVPEYRADYLAHYRALYEEVFTTQWVEALGQRYQDLVRDAARAEADAQGRISGAYTFRQFEANLRSDVTTGGSGGPGAMAPGIVSLVRDRRAYLTGLEDLWSPNVGIAQHRHAPEAPSVTDLVPVSASFSGTAPIRAVQLRYRLDGGFEHQMAMEPDGTGGWRAILPPQRAGSVVTYVFRVALEDGRSAFFPSATLTKPFRYQVAGVDLPVQQTGDLVLNELMADNESAIADEAGEYDDWIELYNRGSQSIELGGYYLSDKSNDPWVFALPDQTLGPGGRLLVWCDNDPEQGPLHADFGLSKDGESVFLSTQAATVDAVTFGALRPDEVSMRLPDGTGAWVTCRAGTPRQANACSPGDVVTPGTPTAVTPGTPTAPTPTGAPGGAATGTPTQSTTVAPSSTATPTRTPAPTEPPRFRIWLPIARR